MVMIDDTKDISCSMFKEDKICTELIKNQLYYQFLYLALQVLGTAEGSFAFSELWHLYSGLQALGYHTSQEKYW